MNIGVHAKSIVALIGSLLSFIGPWILQTSAALPPPWPALIGGIFALLTMFGVYRVPNQLTQEQVNHAVAKGNVSVGAIPGPATAWPTS